jgi:hypothetical protein
MLVVAFLMLTNGRIDENEPINISLIGSGRQQAPAFALET